MPEQKSNTRSVRRERRRRRDGDPSDHEADREPDGPPRRPAGRDGQPPALQAAGGRTGRGISGEEAYRRYAGPMRTFVESRGGRFLWIGRVDSQVIGSGGEGFHMIGLVEYPSREAFLAIATDPHVQEIGVHRAAGLESQWLIAATTVKGELRERRR